LAYEVDKLHHGTPSGIDNTVITYEKPIYFIKQGFDLPGTQEVFQVSKPFVIVIADTGIPSPTSQAVGDVRTSWQKDKTTFEALFEHAGKIANQARTAIASGEISALGPLMNSNQLLLDQMGVSSAKLDRLIQTALEAGAPGAKLSGGGRGGNMIALATKDTSRKVAAALRSAGATSTIITTVSS
jgi:mevalonate kinase